MTVKYLTFEQFESQLEQRHSYLFFEQIHLVKKYIDEEDDTDGYVIRDDDIEHIMLRTDILVLFPDGQFCTIDEENLTLQYN